MSRCFPMTDFTGRGFVTDKSTSQRMKSVSQNGTKPEIVVRDVLDSLDIKFESNSKELPGRPDIFSSSGKWTIFVHGCFWHRHVGCPKATTPKRNQELWEDKFIKTKNRDLNNLIKLHKLGYATLVVWECETRHIFDLSRTIYHFVNKQQDYLDTSPGKRQGDSGEMAKRI